MVIKTKKSERNVRVFVFIVSILWLKVQRVWGEEVGQGSVDPVLSVFIRFSNYQSKQFLLQTILEEALIFIVVVQVLDFQEGFYMLTLLSYRISYFSQCLKVVSATFLVVCFLSLNESSCQTRENAFYFASKALFIFEKIKFQYFRFSNFMTSSNA